MALSEMFFGDCVATAAADPSIHLSPITDGKSLFGSVRTLTGMCEDKRTQIDIISVR